MNAKDPMNPKHLMNPKDLMSPKDLMNRMGRAPSDSWTASSRTDLFFTLSSQSLQSPKF